MAKRKIQSVQDIANELLEVRLDKAELTTKDKLLSEALKKHPDFKQQDLFVITQAVSVIVKDAEKAMAWAQENAPQLIEVNTAKARRLFERDMKIPEGFDTKLTDRLIAKGNDNEEI